MTGRSGIAGVASHTESGEGWKARKRQQTRQRIADAGIRLFFEFGFEETTLDAVAEAAGIARRTFFHYFDSKEALLTAYEHEGEQIFQRALAQIPDTTSPFAAMSLAILGLVSSFGTDEAKAVDQLMRSTETLRARKQANYERLEQFVGAALTERWSNPADHLRLQMFAMVGVGSLRIAADRWTNSHNSRSLRDHLMECFAELDELGLKTS